MIARQLLAAAQTDDPIADVQRLIPVFRQFCLDYPTLARVKFLATPPEFRPGPKELTMSPSGREIFVDRTKRCTDAGLLTGDPVDIARVLLALHRAWWSRKAAAGWQVESVSEPALGRWDERDSARLRALTLWVITSHRMRNPLPATTFQ